MMNNNVIKKLMDNVEMAKQPMKNELDFGVIINVPKEIVGILVKYRKITENISRVNYNIIYYAFYELLDKTIKKLDDNFKSFNQPNFLKCFFSLSVDMQYGLSNRKLYLDLRDMQTVYQFLKDLLNEIYHIERRHSYLIRSNGNLDDIGVVSKIVCLKRLANLYRLKSSLIKLCDYYQIVLDNYEVREYLKKWENYLDEYHKRNHRNI